jgi:Tfp pilus assembly protein FimV
LQLDSSDERLLSEYRVSVPSAASQATYLIKPGDSLGRIAQAIRPDEAIQLQAIVRYLHANNLQAFAQGDINRIVVGRA